MFELPRSLWANRRLLKDFVVRDLKARYVGSSMGFFWSVIFPIVSLFIYMFVFRKVLKARWSDQMPESVTALVMLCGILVWSAFAETLSRSANAMIENSNLIKKVVFPSEILPSYLTISSIVNMSIGFPVLLCGVVWFGYLFPAPEKVDTQPRAQVCDVEFALAADMQILELELQAEAEARAQEAAERAAAAKENREYVAPPPDPEREAQARAEREARITNPSAKARGFTQQEDVPLELKFGAPLLILPLLYLLQAIFTIGLGCLLATMNVYMRDTVHLVGVFVLVWMFATPIFYSDRLVIAAGYGWLLQINPMYWLIESYRDVMLWGTWPDWALLARFAVVAAFTFLLGSRFLTAKKSRFPDLL